MLNRSNKPVHASTRNRLIFPVKKKSPGPQLQLEWAADITNRHWATYCLAIGALRGAGIPFLLGGGFALGAYIGRWRNTKDIDFYILPQDREAAVNALAHAGFEDLFPKLPYDRNWIYRSTRGDVIVDIIWAMANQRAHADKDWFAHAIPATLRDEEMLVMPVEEFLWCKLYIMQRDHCDWPDVFNLLYAVGAKIDWNRLLRLVGDDWPLLKGILTVYNWLCPVRARELPGSLRKKLKLPVAKIPRQKKRDPVHLLDSRNWFAALLPKGRPLEV